MKEGERENERGREIKKREGGERDRMTDSETEIIFKEHEVNREGRERRTVLMKEERDGERVRYMDRDRNRMTDRMAGVWVAKL